MNISKSLNLHSSPPRQMVLFIILLLLMIAVGGEKGAKSFFLLIFNFIALFILLWLITLGVDPIRAMVFGCIIICSITLFYINGVNKKAGTPQGGIISPCLAGLALNGTGSMLAGKFKSRWVKRKENNNKVHTIFYADDFIITGTRRATTHLFFK